MEERNIARHRKIRLPESVYVSCCRTSTLIDKERNGFIVLEDDGWRTIRRVVTAKSFYGLSTGRFDAVLFREIGTMKQLLEKATRRKFLFGLE